MNSRGVLLIIIIQALIIGIVFNQIIFSGGKYVFNSQYDGAKNYFALQGFVQQEQQQEYLKFGLMNYPYGDYLFYTDNTPLVAVPLRFFLNDVFGQPQYAIYIFNLFILLGIVLSSIILFKVLQFFSVNGGLLILFSIMLPWLCPQMLRLGGHFNLTLSWILLLIIYLLCRRSKGNSIVQDILLAFVLFLSGFIHMYYLLLSLVFVFSYFFFSALSQVSQPRKLIAEIVRGSLVCIFAFCLFFLAIKGIDDYYELRKTTAEGYDLDDWKLQLRGLYTPYFFHPLNKLFNCKPLPYESFGYIGTGTIISVFGLMVFSFVGFKDLIRSKLTSISRNAATKVKGENRIAALLFAASLVGLLISLGEHIHIYSEVHVRNYLSPFFYLRIIFPQISHFRCLGRFSWFFFWMINIGTLLIVIRMAKRHRYFKPVFIAAVAGYAVDTIFTLNHLSNDYKSLNPFHNGALVNAGKSIETIQPRKYQALLTFPFYHVGSEDYNYTIDPEDNYCIKTMQMSLISGLPLINSKMARTPLAHTYNIFSIFGERIDESLIQQFNDLPVLVYLDKGFYSNDSIVENKIPGVSRSPAKETMLHGHRIIEKYRMQKICEDESGIFYDWIIKVRKDEVSLISSPILRD